MTRSAARGRVPSSVCPRRSMQIIAWLKSMSSLSDVVGHFLRHCSASKQVRLIKVVYNALAEATLRRTEILGLVRDRYTLDIFVFCKWLAGHRSAVASSVALSRVCIVSLSCPLSLKV